MECKNSAPMVVSASKDIHVSLAYDLTKELQTHNGWDTGARSHLRWAKRQAHKADRRITKISLREAIVPEADEEWIGVDDLPQSLTDWDYGQEEYGSSADEYARYLADRAEYEDYLMTFDDDFRCDCPMCAMHD